MFGNEEVENGKVSTFLPPPSRAIKQKILPVKKRLEIKTLGFSGCILKEHVEFKRSYRSAEVSSFKRCFAKHVLSLIRDLYGLKVAVCISLVVTMSNLEV